MDYGTGNSTLERPEEIKYYGAGSGDHHSFFGGFVRHTVITPITAITTNSPDQITPLLFKKRPVK